MENLQVVILKCPYINWAQEKTQKFFSKMVSLKLKSYCEKHHVGVMPVDATDFISDHILICSSNNGELTPVLGVKSLDYERCKTFHVDFTIESFLKRGEHYEHLDFLYDTIKQCENNNRKISYYSSWATLPTVTRNRPLSNYLKKIFTGLTVLHHNEEGISDLLGLGVPKYRTDNFFYKWGFERVAHNGTDLENIPFFILGNIDGVFIHLKEYSQLALDCAEEALDLWEDRLVIGHNPEQKKDSYFQQPTLS